MKNTLLLLLCIIAVDLSAQVGVSTTPATPDPSAMLDIQSQDRGLLIPRMTQAERDAIVAPAHALLVYQTDVQSGFYFNQGTTGAPNWISLGPLSGIHLEDRIPIDSLPYDITSSGSYYVVTPLSGDAGITINASNVTLDLNGHSLIGTSGNASAGIEVTGSHMGIAIINGAISDWGHEGIAASSCDDCQFSQLRIDSSGYDGLHSGAGSIIDHVISSHNGFDGIDAGQGAVVSHCAARGNNVDGIEADAGSAITHCASNQNMLHGFRANGSCTITNNAAKGNQGHGFFAGAGAILEQNSADDNSQSGFYLSSGCHAQNNTSRNNTKYGFECLDACIVTSNTAQLNTLSGFYTTFSGSRFDGNASNDNAQHGFHINNSGDCLLIRNSTIGNTVSAYTILPGNIVATIVTSATINTNNNPFANFQY